jgi:hypothetical protein
VRVAAEPFVQLGLLYEGPPGAGLEVSVADASGLFGEWTPVAGVLEEGLYVADLPLPAPALRYRLRAAGDRPPPAWLAVELLTGADLAGELEGPEDLTDEVALDDDLADELPEGVSSSSYAVTMRKFRFDRGKVTRPWLWLLRTARREGWSGHLAGTRTGLRTYQQQLELWNAFQNGTGAPAFPPWGPSRHLIRNVQARGRWYMAIDTQDVPRLIQIARRHGVRLHRPYSNEPWHVEAVQKFHAPAGWTP